MASPEDGFISGLYEILPGDPPVGAGGQVAYSVRDHRQGRRDLLAVQVMRDLPARSVALSTLVGEQIDGMILPLAHGVGRLPGGREGYFVIQPAIAGTAVLEMDGRVAPWGERALIENLLRPAALALDRLAGLGLTHRAIRAGNVFQSREGMSVTLGGGWATPPAALQPAVFEPPYAAMCHPSGRGEGDIADDVYALGVLLISLALGAVPMAGVSAEEVVHRKLERGSFAALVGNARLPPGIADLARGMLAEDPEHRPMPVLLADPLAARSRRVAARPPPRAQTPLELGGVPVWDARMLAFAAFRAPEEGLRLLRGAEIDAWLRRALGDPLLAARVDEAVRAARNPQHIEEGSADQLLLLRCISALDPLAPCCWHGVALFPDGVGPLAAAAGGPADRVGLRHVITSLLLGDGPSSWAQARGERVDLALLRLDWRQNRLLLHIPGWAGGFARLRYALNPLLPCLSPLVADSCVVRLSDLLPALEKSAQASVATLVDEEVAAFISARLKGRMDAEFATLAVAENPDIDPPGARGLAALRVLARLAEPDPAQRWMAISSVLLRAAEAAIGRWHSVTARQARLEALRGAAAEGALVTMAQILDDQADLQHDNRQAQSAGAQIGALEAQLDQIGTHLTQHRRAARQTAQEIAAACGTILLVGLAVLRAMP